jgi:hypothetical protein
MVRARSPLITALALLCSGIAISWFALAMFYYHLPDGPLFDALGCFHLLTFRFYYLFGLTGLAGFVLSCSAFRHTRSIPLLLAGILSLIMSTYFSILITLLWPGV